MPRYYCYIVKNEILQRFLPVGGELPRSIPNAILSVICDGDVLYTSQARHVLNASGECRWSIALAYSGRGDGLPSKPPPEDRYRELKAVLGTDKPPVWRRAAN